METDPPPLAYATPEPFVVAVDHVRRIFAWFAIGYAATICLSGIVNAISFWHIYQLRGPRLFYWIAVVPLSIPLAIGAGMTLRGRASGPSVVRLASLGVWITSILSGVVSQLHLQPGGGPLSYRLGEFGGRLALVTIASAFSVPALLFCLSFPLRRAR